MRELPRVIRSCLAISMAVTGRRRMHAHRQPIIGRLAISITAAAAVVIVAALAGAPQPSIGRPPSTEAPIAADAFRPVSVPDEVGPAPTSWTGLASEPDGKAPDPSTPDPSTPDPSTPDRPTPDRPTPDRSTPDTADSSHSERDAAEPVAPEPSPPDGPVHVVRPGDNLWLIAAWHKVELEPILTWNPGVDPRGLVAGQEILVPGGAPMPANATPPAPRPAQVPAQAPAQAPAPSSDGSGSHLWPLPIRGTITTRFSGAHPGIDIAAPSGTPVRAIADGTVVYAGWRGNGGGYVVEIRHPNGMTSTYNHNREVAVTVGQVVATGEQIAWVGSTGNSTGPHLDLRVEMGGRLVNPLRLDW